MEQVNGYEETAEKESRSSGAKTVRIFFFLSGGRGWEEELVGGRSLFVCFMLF